MDIVKRITDGKDYGFDIFKEIIENEYQMTVKSERTYKKILKHKQKTIMKNLSKTGSLTIEVPSLSKENYVEIMRTNLIEEIKQRAETEEKYLGQRRRFTNEDIEKMLENFSIEEILENHLKENKNINGKTFIKGTRTIKAMQKIQSEIDEHMGERLLGSLKPNEQDIKRVFITIKPEAFVFGTTQIKTCLSPEHNNSSYALVYPAVSYMAMAYTEDFSWRAWVLFDKESETFSIVKGYPRENFYAQGAVYHFLKSKGYVFKGPITFNRTFYLDNEAGIDGIASSNKRIYPFVTEKTYLKYDLYSDKKIVNSDLQNIQGAYCDDCGILYLGNQKFLLGLCYLCAEGRGIE